MTDLVLFGTGAAARTVAVYLDRHSDYRIVGYTVDAAFRDRDRLDGRPVVDWEDLERHFPPGAVELFGPFSYARMNGLRRDRYREGKARGYRFASFLHPASHIYAETIGENCLILEACVIQPFVRIGDNVIVWSMTAIGHHCEIGDHCFIASQVGLAGSVRVGAESYLGARAAVVQGVSVGPGSALLNAAGVARDLPALSVVVGREIKPWPSTRLHRLL